MLRPYLNIQEFAVGLFNFAVTRTDYEFQNRFCAAGRRSR